MKIVIVAEHGAVGAAETYAFSLAAALSTLGDDVELWVYPEIRSEAEGWIAGSPTRIVEIPHAAVSRFRFALGRLRARRPDVVHVNHAVSPVLMAAALARSSGRFVTDHVLPLTPKYGFRGALLRRLTRTAAREVIVFSEQNASVASQSWGSTPVRVIYPGVPEPRCTKKRSQVREDLGFGEDAVVVTSVGRLTEQKRMDVLLRALAELGDPRVRGLVVGDGPDRQALTTLASDLGVGSRVIFTGHRSHVGCLLGASDIYVQASAWEGICFALLEAMAVGLPCVISDLAALNEAVDGCGAPVVAVGEVGQLAAALDVLLSDQAASTDLGKRLEVRWGQRFTVERMASNHRAAYMAAAGGEDRA